MSAARTRNNTLCTPPADPVTGPAGDAGGGASSRRLSATEATAPKSLTDTILAVMQSDDKAGVLKHATNVRKIEALRAENNGTFAAAWNEALHAKRETTGSGVMESLAAAAGGGDPAEDGDVNFDPATIEAEGDATTAPRILNAATWLALSLAPIVQLLPGLLDAGAKMLVNGSSKSRKTFVVIQLALCLATGRQFLKWPVAKKCRVLLLQGEVTETHFHARLVRALKAMGLTTADLGDRLQIVNSRGTHFTLDNPPQWLLDAAGRVDLVIVDPVYKFFQGEENSGTDAAAFLRGLDRLSEQSGAAIAYVHHSAKGTAGDRQTIDRGSGSGVFARDFDASLYLGQHAAEDGVLVVEPIVRAYPPTEPFCIEFQDGAFVESDHAPQVARSSDRARASRTKLDDYWEGALRMLRESGPLSPSIFKQRLRDELHASKTTADNLTTKLCDEGPAVRWREGGFSTAWKIGLQNDDAPTSRLLPGSRQEEGEEG